jgi:adenylate kinase
MRVLLLAPPGAGKGTQGALLSARFDIPHIATGDILRAELRAGTPLGQQVERTLARGELVSDDIMLEIVLNALEASRSRGGYILDGFPRTVGQAIRARELARERGLQARLAIHFVVSDDEVTRRLTQRAEGRADDTADVIRRRLELYHEVSAPVTEYYRHKGMLVEIDAMRPVQEITAEAIHAVQEAVAAAG